MIRRTALPWISDSITTFAVRVIDRYAYIWIKSMYVRVFVIERRRNQLSLRRCAQRGLGNQEVCFLISRINQKSLSLALLLLLLSLPHTVKTIINLI